MNRILFQFTIYIIFSIYSPKLHAQEYFFEKISVDDGLSHITVNDIYQDEIGRMWFATRYGLNSYDGNVIKQYKTEDSDFYIPLVTKIVGDNNGHLFIKAHNSLVEFDLKTEKFRTIIDKKVSTISKGKNCLWISAKNSIYKYDFTSKQLSYEVTIECTPADVFYCIMEDSKGLYWIGSSIGVHTYDKKHNLRLLYSNYQVRDIFEDSKKNIWLSTTKSGLVKITKSGELTEYKTGKNNALITNSIRCAREDNLGNIWIASQLGLCILNPQTNKIGYYFSDNKNPKALSSNSITSIFKDRQGTIWLSTYFGGVNYVNPKSQQFRYYPTNKSGLDYSIVGKMTQDSRGVIWIGTEGGGLISYNPRNSEFKSYQNLSYTNLNVKEIFYDKQRECLWMGYPENGLDRFDILTGRLTSYKQPLKNLKIVPFGEQFLIGSSQRLGILNPQNPEKETVVYPDKEKYNLEPSVLSLLYDSQKRVWIGTNYGLYIYDVLKDKLNYYQYDSGKIHSISGNLITAIIEDKSKRIWLVAMGGGLNLFETKTGSFIRYTSKTQRLLDNNVTAIAESQSGNIIIGSSKGVSILNPTNNKVRNYSTKDGFPLAMVNENALFVSKENEIYAGGVGGMVVFKEDELQFQKIRPSKIWISQLFVDNKEINHLSDNSVSFSKKIEINPGYTVFSIKAATDNFIKNNKINIEYRLKDYDDKWQTEYNQQIPTFTNISPGSYVFEARIKEYPAISTSIHLVVMPPFYKTWYAYSLYIILLAAIAWFLNREAQARFYLKTSLEFEKKEKQRTEELVQNKLNFFTNISHELNTPLTLILAQTDTLLKSFKLSPTIKNKVVSIYKNTDDLKQLIGELIEFRKQEDGFVNLRILNINLQDLLAEIYSYFNEYAMINNMNFKLITPSHDLFIWVDPNNLRKAINNILFNAFKFTQPEGEIILELQESEESVSISISDTGIGLDPDNINNIFNRFYQTDLSNTNGGFGIGLAFTKAIVEAHKGTIVAKNRDDKQGAVFQIELKKGAAHLDTNFIASDNQIEERQDSIENTNALLSDEKNISNPNNSEEDKIGKILIIEDNKGLVDLLFERFTPLYEVEIAYNGQVGLEKARESHPDLIVSDVMLPQLTGIELCQILKNNLDTCHIPIILLTARSSATQQMEGLMTGADDYITKPFDVNLLLVRCGNLLKNRKLLQNKYFLDADAFPQILTSNALDLDILNKATELVLNNIYNEDFNVDFFAQELGLSRTSLFNKIKGISGLTPNNFIQNIKLKKAAEMLLNRPELNISEIGYELGFSSPKYFKLSFKKLFAYTPSEYRDKNKN
jgi:signal transduction histidine kinase/ligand-binding sensor domain-containing protein/DNA-binding response OmpR family regulator